MSVEKVCTLVRVFRVAALRTKTFCGQCSASGLFYDASMSVYLVPNATCILANICAWQVSMPLPDDTTFAPSGVCAGNWTRKEKRSMGLLMPHRTLVCASPSRSPLAYYQFEQKKKQIPVFDSYEYAGAAFDEGDGEAHKRRWRRPLCIQRGVKNAGDGK